jgi:hypothetical protein
MTAKRPPALLPTLQNESQRQRETAATALFNLDAVRLALHQAAHKGQSTIRLRTTLPGLQRTDAAKSLTEWCKHEGISLTWEKRLHEIPDETRQVEIMEPEFSW